MHQLNRVRIVVIKVSKGAKIKNRYNQVKRYYLEMLELHL